MAAHDALPERDGPWIFAGTVPDPDFPLVAAPFTVENGALYLEGRACPVNRGTPAMLAAARISLARLSPGASISLLAFAAGDTGKGDGSREVYKALVRALPELRPRGVTFHYLLPDVDWHNRILMAADALERRPVMAADAGFMYAAKMSGYAGRYDLFTPDIGELAFLADAHAPHPFYTRNFLLADEARAEELIREAHTHGNAAKHMLVKGKIDRYVRGGSVEAAVDTPDIPMLEPVGGTGDTLTGIVSAMLASGMDMAEACVAALRANRLMGLLARPTPASSVADLLRCLPRALEGIKGFQALQLITR